EIMTKAQPDISYFENNNMDKAPNAVSNTNDMAPKVGAADNSNYFVASSTVFGGAVLRGLGGMYIGLFPDNNEEAKFQNGQWVWSYEYAAEGISWSMKFTAKDLGSSIKWAMFQSYDDGEISIQDAKILEGTASKDLST